MSCNQADADGGRLPRPVAGNAAARFEMDAAVALGQGWQPARPRAAVAMMRVWL